MPAAISGAVLPPAVVRADHQHDGLGLKALAFAVVQAPEHALRRVAGDGEVRRLDVREVLVEHRLVLVVLHPPVGDRVAVQEQVDVALPGAFDEPFVPRAHPLHGLRVGRGGVHAKRREQHHVLVALEQRRRRRLVAADELRHGVVHLRHLGGRRQRDLGRDRRRRPDDDGRQCRAAPLPAAGGRRGLPRLSGAGGRRRCGRLREDRARTDDGGKNAEPETLTHVMQLHGA